MELCIFDKLSEKVAQRYGQEYIIWHVGTHRGNGWVISFRRNRVYVLAVTRSGDKILTVEAAMRGLVPKKMSGVHITKGRGICLRDIDGRVDIVCADITKTRAKVILFRTQASPSVILYPFLPAMCMGLRLVGSGIIVSAYNHFSLWRAATKYPDKVFAVILGARGCPTFDSPDLPGLLVEAFCLCLWWNV